MAGIPSRIVAYSGNGAYCYSNSLHMCLRSRSPSPGSVPEPGFIECLTTMPFGNFYLGPPGGPLLFFSPPNLNPNDGLARAMDTLGWTWKVEHPRDSVSALALLRKALKRGPVLAGPLDLGLLAHNPAHASLGGVDHYVTVLGVDEDLVRFHDPEGYPYVALPSDDFLQAWRAERIGFPHEPYTLRFAFRRVRQPSRRRMIERTLRFIPGNLAADPGGPTVYGGPAALRHFAESLRQEVSLSMSNFQTFFAYPLGARRSADAACFLAEASEPKAAQLMERKAELLGTAQYWGVRGDWSRVAEILGTLAKVEEALASSL